MLTGYLASSKAGHDKDKIYVITAEDEEYVWLSDGEARPVEKPKKKNKKHIQIIKVFTDEEIKSGLIRKEEVSDLQIRQFIKNYRKQQSKLN